MESIALAAADEPSRHRELLPIAALLATLAW
jgi:hypothetical protein